MLEQARKHITAAFEAFFDRSRLSWRSLHLIATLSTQVDFQKLDHQQCCGVSSSFISVTTLGVV